MRFLVDENFPGPVVRFLRSEDHDILSARMDFPGLSDRTLIERAEADGRIILTLDRDFWQLALQRPVLLRSRTAA
jgi:predicted nuclease of predicted toxin-antitoxin system